MAITVTKNINDNINHAYNNSVIEFQSTLDINSKFAIVDVNGVSLKITPNTANLFRYNFKEIIKILINSNNFSDDVSPAIQSGDETSITYDGTASTYIVASVTISITYEDDTTETITRDYNFLRSAEQHEDFLNGSVTGDNDTYLMLPFDDDSAQTYYARYFEGYPFDISVLRIATGGQLDILNRTNSIDYTFTSPQTNVNRIFFSDGRTDVSIQDYVPLLDGFNSLLIDDNVVLDLQKTDAGCGVYIKWLNNYGGWCYWLFSDIHERSRKIKTGKEVFNDFGNLGENNTPYFQLGNETGDELELNYQNATPRDKKIIDTIADSPSIYLFIGKPFSQSTNDNWLRVELMESSMMIRDFKDSLYNVDMKIKLPTRNTLKV